MHPAASARPRARARALLVALLVALGASLVFASCGRADPAGLSASLDPRVAKLAHWVAFRHPGDGALYFLDRFETREEDLAAIDPASPVTSGPDLPLVNLSLRKALAHARAYWARLPTFAEWRHAVEGAPAYRFPWGEDSGPLRANSFELGFSKRTRVGTFEAGRDHGRAGSPYDLFGNVSEWTLSPQVFVERDRLGQVVQSFPDRVDLQPLAAVYERLFALPGSFPFLAELCPALEEGRPAGQVSFRVVGFSFAEPLQPPGAQKWSALEKLGVRERGATDRASDLGMRMATDPNCLLAGLERASGGPSPAEREALEAFLGSQLAAFRAAALRRRLDTRRPSGGWIRAARSILGL